jgi:uncharacterized protein (TIGR00290 family)
MRLAVLFSGGKDSVYAAFFAMQQGFDPFLLTIIPEDYSMMFHHPNVHLAPIQAERMGLDHVFVKATDSQWEDILFSKLKEMGAEGIVTGAIASEYQRWRIARVAERLGIPDYSPLWHKGQALYSEMLEYLETSVIAVSAEGLGKEHLGRPLSDISKNPPLNIHPFLEGGEGETFVSDAPFFSRKINIRQWEISWDGVRGVARIEEAD